jgi:hypothetical protein
MRLQRMTFGSHGEKRAVQMAVLLIAFAYRWQVAGRDVMVSTATAMG